MPLTVAFANKLCARQVDGSAILKPFNISLLADQIYVGNSSKL